MKKMILAGLLLAGCAADDTSEVMARYRAQPIESVTARLGLPQGETTIMGRRAYIWNRTNYDTATTQSLTTGTIGNISVVATTYGTESYSTICALRVFVDGASRITGYDFHGQQGACRSLSAKLR